jgi:aryl-alcohol dehydrogenase-like predicted oxidoreductase
MGSPTESPLILGGHSFITQLGSDPPPSEREQHKIVESCLDHGIRWFDTTYQPERRALGNALHALGRRDEATIFAWNFFTDFSPGDPVPEPEYYRREHIDLILEQLRTARLDCLVVLPLDDPDENQRQEELVRAWRKKGYVRSLGLWIPDLPTIERYPEGDPFQFAIRPFNITTEEAAPIFAACKLRGWETVATSPFSRGWELDRILAGASARGYGDKEALRPVVADLMLRFSLFQRDVDRVIVAMRKVEWVIRNVQSVGRGPLSAEEHRWLQRLQGLPAKRRRWWQRLGRRS